MADDYLEAVDELEEAARCLVAAADKTAIIQLAALERLKAALRPFDEAKRLLQEFVACG